MPPLRKLTAVFFSAKNRSITASSSSIFFITLPNTKEQEANVGIITLTSKDYALNEVVVKGERPLVKVESGRLTYDMPQLTANKLVTNAYEAVKQLPGVIEQNDVLTLAGRSSVSLILNGVPSSMTYEQLISKNMRASRVERGCCTPSAAPRTRCGYQHRTERLQTGRK